MPCFRFTKIRFFGKSENKVFIYDGHDFSHAHKP